MHRMDKGKWYKIRHRNSTQKFDRKSVMQYLGIESHAVNIAHVFNARPTAGTQVLMDTEIISVEAMPTAPAPKPFVAARWK